MDVDASIEQVTGIPRERAEFRPHELTTSIRAQLAELWRCHRGRLLFGMALDFSEAAAYYGLFTFLSVFVLTKGVVDVPAGTVPYAIRRSRALKRQSLVSSGGGSRDSRPHSNGLSARDCGCLGCAVV